MARMMLRYLQPANERDFEELCLLILRTHWQVPDLQLYGRRGQGQTGIDIVDPSGRKDVRGAQCKQFAADHAITGSEIEKEVVKAETFRPQLQEYWILTTAKQSTEAQQTVSSINSVHTQQGLFHVRLLTWQDIEILLREYPQIAESFYGPMSPELVQTVRSGMSAISSATAALETYSEDSFDRDIDAAKASIIKRDLTIAKFQLHKLRNEQWHRLNSRQRFRVLSNLGAVHLAEGAARVAAELFLQAKPFFPEDEKAQSNEALAHYLLEDLPQAFSLATEVRERFPNCASAAATWINSAPQTKLTADLEKDVPVHIRTAAEPAVALARRYLAENPKRAEEYARLAAEKEPEWPIPWMLMGHALVRQQPRPDLHQDVRLLDSKVVKALQNAEGAFSKAAGLAEKHGFKDVQADALANRAMVLQSLRRHGEAAKDVEAAHILQPTNPDTARDFAELLINRRDARRAVEVLEPHWEEKHSYDIGYVLANAYRARRHSGDALRAASIYAEVATSKDPISPVFRAHLVSRAIDSFVSAQSMERAEALLDDLPADSLSVFTVALFRTNIKVLKGERESATSDAKSLLERLSKDTEREDVEYLAIILSDLGLHREALELWEKNIELGAANITAYERLIDCASRLKLHDVELKYAERLRLAGIFHPPVFLHEVSILEHYDLDKAIAILQESLATNNDPEIRLRLSLIGHTHDRPSLIASQLADMPAVEEVSAQNGWAAVHLMKLRGDVQDALTYAYRLLHLHFSEIDAHRAFMFVLHPIGPTPTIIQPEAGGPGTAVALTEEGVPTERWFVIEDLVEPDPRLDEIAPSHPMARLLQGKKVGEKVNLAEGQISKRVATITKILNKYVFRYQRCGDEWQLRFPDKPDLQVFRILSRADRPDELDLHEIERVMRNHADNVKKAIDFYRSRPIPFETIATAVGRTAIETQEVMANADPPFVRCCVGNVEERELALNNLSSTNALVLDVSAVITLSLIGALDVLKNSQVPLFTSQNVLDALREERRNAEPSDAKAGFMIAGPAGLGIIETPKAEQEDRWRQLSELVTAAEAGLQVVPAIALAAVPPDRRELLIKTCGRQGADTIAIASQSGRMLWTDDFALAGLSATEFGVRRAWTQIVLEHLASTGSIAPERYFECSAKLAGFGYSFTSVSPEVLVRAGRVASWNVGAWPLKGCITVVQSRSINDMTALQLALSFLVALYREPMLEETRTQVATATLDAVLSRSSGIPGVLAIRAAAPRLFGLNVVGLQHLLNCLDAWYAFRQKGSRNAILP
jgi:tetratricopeptide (TPR) repeat protein